MKLIKLYSPQDRTITKHVIYEGCIIENEKSMITWTKMYVKLFWKTHLLVFTRKMDKVNKYT